VCWMGGSLPPPAITEPNFLMPRRELSSEQMIVLLACDCPTYTCVHVCIYIYMNLCIYVYACIYIYMNWCIHVCIYPRTGNADHSAGVWLSDPHTVCVCMHNYMHLCIYLSVYREQQIILLACDCPTYTRVRVCMYIYMNWCIYVYPYLCIGNSRL